MTAVETDNRRILIVDDNTAIHEDFRQILLPPAHQTGDIDALEAAMLGVAAPVVSARVPFDVEFSLQGQDGFAAAQRATKEGRPFALAFVDMRMPPGWDGIETIEHLWKVDRELQVVICTAYGDYTWDDVIRRLGRTDKLLLLKKPFDSTEVWQLACALTEKWNISRRSRQRLVVAQRLNKELRLTVESLKRTVGERTTVASLLKHSATHDGLTGLPKRGKVVERLDAILENPDADERSKHAVLCLDLDNFKLVNDSHGHDFGDQVLGIVAGRLRVLAPTMAHVEQANDEGVARIGDDEFAFVLSNLAHPTDAAVLAEQLIECVSKPIEVNGEGVIVTASVGIAVCGSHYSTADEILRDADTAMYRAKVAGKARYALFDANMHLAARARLQLENDLRRAVEHEEFRLVYQPIVCMPGAELVGFEALIRWDRGHAVGGLPSSFVPVAEESGLIVPLGRWVIREACRQIDLWRRAMGEVPPVYVSVNISRRQLVDVSLPDDVAAGLREYDLPPRVLNLEVTESGVIDDLDSAAARLRQLKQLGVGLFMDDFGTGYSSLGCLNALPFDVVKIDRSFVRAMRSSHGHSAVIKAIVTLAHAFNMRVTVEGVETADELAAIRALGCDYVQGYFFSKPVDPETAGSWLAHGGPLLDRLANAKEALAAERH